MCQTRRSGVVLLPSIITNGVTTFSLLEHRCHFPPPRHWMARTSTIPVAHSVLTSPSWSTWMWSTTMIRVATTPDLSCQLVMASPVLTPQLPLLSAKTPVLSSVRSQVDPTFIFPLLNLTLFVLTLHSTLGWCDGNSHVHLQRRCFHQTYICKYYFFPSFF